MRRGERHSKQLLPFLLLGLFGLLPQLPPFARFIISFPTKVHSRQPSRRSALAFKMAFTLPPLPYAYDEKFTGVLLGLKGSGWGWLVQDVETGALEITTSRDQDIVPAGKKPLLGVDMWEHAYYLQYLNDKAGYAKGVWAVINWAKLEQRFEGGVEAVFGPLAGLRSSI
ncbi:unnamed protein product [Diplocarpon coronariae]